jgi:hypothetical protein
MTGAGDKSCDVIVPGAGPAGENDPADRAPRRHHRHRLLRAHTECAGSLVRAASGRFVPAPPRGERSGTRRNVLSGRLLKW